MNTNITETSQLQKACGFVLLLIIKCFYSFIILFLILWDTLNMTLEKQYTIF